MKNPVWLAFLMTVLFVTSSYSINQTANVYLIDLTVGNVEISRNNGRVWIPAVVDSDLNSSDMIRTGPQSYCEITLPENQGSFRILENSEIRLSSLGKAFRVNVRRGRSLFDLFRPLFADESFNVETDTAIASVRGTQFLVENTGDALMVSVVHGTVSAMRNVPFEVDPDLIEDLRNAVEVKLAGGEEMEFHLLDNQKFMRTVKALSGNRNDLKNFLLKARKEIRMEVRTFRNRARIMSVIDEHQADLQRVRQRQSGVQRPPAVPRRGMDELRKLYRFKRSSDSLLPRRMSRQNNQANRSAAARGKKPHKPGKPK